MTIEGEPRNVVDGRNAELGQVRYGIVREGRMRAHRPTVDVAELMAKATTHLAQARERRAVAGASLQRAQLALVESPGPTTDAAVRRTRQALDEAEGAEDLARREIASYQVRVWQARTDAEADDVP
jgi:hypothetical protein